jgi:hypothetical protein
MLAVAKIVPAFLYYVLCRDVRVVSLEGSCDNREKNITSFELQ